MTLRSRALRLAAPIPFLLLLLATSCQPFAQPTRHQKAEGALGPYSGSVSTGELCFLSGKNSWVSVELQHLLQELSTPAMLGTLSEAKQADRDFIAKVLYAIHLAVHRLLCLFQRRTSLQALDIPDVLDFVWEPCA